MAGGPPTNDENPPSPLFHKGGLGGFRSYFLHNEQGEGFSLIIANYFL